jgi:hypothetical protein
MLDFCSEPLNVFPSSGNLVQSRSTLALLGFAFKLYRHAVTASSPIETRTNTSVRKCKRVRFASADAEYR